LLKIGLLLAATCIAQTALTITTANLPSGTVGTPYPTTALAVSGGTQFTAFQWSATGALPTGLTLSSAGQISGTPTVAGSFSFDITVRASDGRIASRRFTITILDVGTGLKPAIATGSLTAATAGVPYSEILQATGGTGGYRWSIVQGVLPAGLTLDGAAGIIAGTPTTPGSSSFSLQVTDSSGQQSAAISVSLTINVPPLAITTVSPLFTGVVGVQYAQTFSVFGGVRPYTWAILSGDPAGLQLDSASGVLRGTPQSTGTFTFTVQVADSANARATGVYSITVNAPSLTVTLAAQPAPGAVGVPYNQKLALAATGGTAPVTWSLLSGSVPGLTFDPVTLSLAGAPTTSGSFTITVQARDAAGLTASRGITLVITPPGLRITTERQLTAVELNDSYLQTMAASGGVPPYTWSATGLPSGLRIDPATGAISGTAAAGGNFSAVISVRDSAFTVVQDLFSILVRLPAPPSVRFSGLSESIEPRQQVALDLGISAPYPTPITGTAFLTFLPDSGLPDRTVVFASGASSLDFTIPVGSTTPQFDSLPMLQTGTVAGTISVTLSLRAGGTDITPSPTPSLTARIARAAPVIGDVQVSRAAGSLSFAIMAYSTTRQITQAVFNFAAAPGRTLETAASSITVDVGSIFDTWFQNAVTTQYGSQFVYAQPFTISGDANAVTPVSVTLRNREGSTTFEIKP
jgi:hypothetical protein